MQSQFQMKPESNSSDSFVKTFPPGGELLYVHDWIDPESADAMYLALRGEVDWQTRTIRMFGKLMMQPRKIAFQGDPGVSYVYSGGLYRAEPWHPVIAGLRNALASDMGFEFNCALLNLYRSERDSMGWHSDDEPELGREPTIASVSLGASRRFVLRGKDDKKCRFELVPGHGSLIVMRGDLQHHWQHQLPKRTRAAEPRINITFRKIVRPPKSVAPRPA